jgi:hypothetical protein
VVVTLVACARPAPTVLEPEGTVTRTWIGTEAPAPAPPAEPAAETAPAPRPAEPPPEKKPDVPSGRAWKKGGSWNR